MKLIIGSLITAVISGIVLIKFAIYQDSQLWITCVGVMIGSFALAANEIEKEIRNARKI